MQKGGWDQCRVLGQPHCAAEGPGGTPCLRHHPTHTSVEGEWGEVSWAVGPRIARQDQAHFLRWSKNAFQMCAPPHGPAVGVLA